MNIIPLLSFTPLAEPTFEAMPVRVALAAGTSYLFGVLASSSPLMCAKVGAIATLAQEVFFLLGSILAGEYRSKNIYAYLNWISSTSAAIVLCGNPAISDAGKCLLVSFAIWNFINWTRIHFASPLHHRVWRSI